MSSYDGPLRITRRGTQIDAKLVHGKLVILAADVRITRSKIVGNVDADASFASVTISDSEIDGGKTWAPTVGFNNITMLRTNVRGGRVSVLCGSNCVIQRSWLHDQYMAPGSDWHVNGYLSNGGSNVLVQHNTIACDVEDNDKGGGCTGPAASFGDFLPLGNIVYDGNFFVATPGGFCLHAGHNPGKAHGINPSSIVVMNNVFQRGRSGKCGTYGAVTSFLAGAAGNTWHNNRWDDGRPVRP